LAGWTRFCPGEEGSPFGFEAAKLPIQRRLRDERLRGAAEVHFS
jgi:hypothetical protein